MIKPQVAQAGWSATTGAAMDMMARGLAGSRGVARSRGRKRKARGARKVSKAVRRVKRRGTSKLKRLVKGSAAAKRYMAKIRRKRK